MGITDSGMLVTYMELNPVSYERKIAQKAQETWQILTAQNTML